MFCIGWGGARVQQDDSFFRWEPSLGFENADTYALSWEESSGPGPGGSFIQTYVINT